MDQLWLQITIGLLAKEVVVRIYKKIEIYFFLKRYEEVFPKAKKKTKKK